jgi:BirA family transcriptional regulator, biotin operon repressor / biotin---[acetyl-CoA-carboxylase] ligase
VKPPVVRLGSVVSTQSVALELAEQGAPDRTVVIAEHQTAGRGRRGARWEDEPGASLLVSMVLRPSLEPARLPTLSYAAAVAVAEALAAVAPVVPRLKWPNDVLVGPRKIAGILLETRLGGMTGQVGARAASNRPPSILPEQAAPATTGPVTTILGIGINLGQRQFSPSLHDRATSVAIETGLAVDREALLTALLDRFDGWRQRLEAEGFDVVRRRWLALSDTIGRAVTVDGASGVALDLDAEGALVLDTGGVRRRVLAGALEA